MAKLTKTKMPGIFRRHAKGCKGRGRCECSYVLVWEHRGKQHTETFRTAQEAREAQGARKAGERRPTSRVLFGDYFAEWIESYAGRTARGFSETTRPEYRRPIEAYAIPKWETWKLAEVEPADVRELFGSMRRSDQYRLRQGSYLEGDWQTAYALDRHLPRLPAYLRVPALR